MADENFHDPDFQHYFYGPEGSVSPRFTGEVMARLIEEFAIPGRAVLEAEHVLEMTSRAYWTQTNRPQIDNQSRRAELNAIVAGADMLSNIFSKTSPETWELIIESGRRQKLDTDPYPRVASTVRDNPVENSEKLLFRSKIFGTQIEIDAQIWVEGIAAMSSCARLAAELAKAGRRGPSPDHAAYFLLLGAFAVWTETLRRDFKILWSDDGQWLTPAARFCFEVARIIDPGIEASRIRTAARRASKEPR